MHARVLKGVWTVPVLAAVFIACPAPVAAQAPGGFDRPSVTVVGLDLAPHLGAALDAACAVRCQTTAIGERADINTLGTWNYQSGMGGLVAGRQWSPGAPAMIQGWLGRSGVSRSTILRLFNVGSDFNWTLDTLAARARYAITVEEAQRLLRAQRGVTRNEFRQILPTYFFVFTIVGDTITSRTVGSGQNAQTFYGSSGTVLGAVYRLGYPDIAVAGAALAPVSCFRGDVPATCQGNTLDTRIRAFQAYEPPLVPVVSFAEPVVAAGANTPDAIRRSLVSNAIGAVAARATLADARFASQGRVIASRPVAVRIGRKEGVSPNNQRYFAMRRDSTPGRPARSVRVGVFIPARVADNRQVVFTTGAGGSRIARMDSTTFTRIHGAGAVEANRGITMQQARYLGSYTLAGMFQDGLTNAGGLVAQAEYRIPGLPSGGYLGLAITSLGVLEGDLGDSTVSLGADTANIIRAGLVYGQEFFPARGLLRFRLQGEFGKAFDVSSGDTTAGQAAVLATNAGLYGTGAATIAIAPSYRWNVFASAAYTKRFAKCDTAVCVSPQGLAWIVGVRVEP